MNMINYRQERKNRNWMSPTTTTSFS